MSGRIWYEGLGLAPLSQAVYVEIDFKWDRRNLWKRVEPTRPTNLFFLSMRESGIPPIPSLIGEIATMQDKPVVHVLTRDEFDVKLLDVKGSQKQMQQDIQDLLNVAVAYAADPKSNDFTFGTKLYKAISKGVRGNKVRGSFERFAGAVWDKDGVEGGQFKKDRNSAPDVAGCSQHINAWWLFENKGDAKDWDAEAFLARTTKSINHHGSKKHFKHTDGEQTALDALINAAHNEGFEINIPQPKYEAPTMAIPDWKQEVEEQIAA